MEEKPGRHWEKKFVSLKRQVTAMATVEFIYGHCVFVFQTKLKHFRIYVKSIQFTAQLATAHGFGVAQERAPSSSHAVIRTHNSGTTDLAQMMCSSNFLCCVRGHLLHMQINF
jgi:hypothetical protein